MILSTFSTACKYSLNANQETANQARKRNTLPPFSSAISVDQAGDLQKNSLFLCVPEQESRRA